jgi:NAD/NADP transhydrogenase beta subunit
MDWENSAKGWGIALIVITALILWYVQRQAGKLQFFTFLSLAIILGVCIVLPVVGIIFAVPIFVLVWMANSKTILALLKSYEGATLG